MSGTPPQTPAPASDVGALDGGPPVVLAPGLVVAERFRLLRPLGQGGMGAVWAAQHVELETPCALKFMHEAAARSAETVARFKREAKAAAQLRSPHVVQILDHGVWHGVPYIAMELLEGEDLHRRLKQLRTLSPPEVFAVAAQVGRALTKAHAGGLVHRDLKPANIFLVRDDDREITKVLDFGVAKVTGDAALAEAHTTTGAVLGTPYYMSPEQLRGQREVDHRADLWALSVVVYQCLVGKLPFRGVLLAELIVKIMVDPIPVPSQAAPELGLPAGFDAWWARAVDRDVSRRFQSARELTDALALALGVTLNTGSTMSELASSARISGLVSAPLTGSGGLAPPTPQSTPGRAQWRAPEELDSGLLHTAMPTVTPGLMASGPQQVTLPPEPRPRSPMAWVIGGVGLAVVGVVAVIALGNHAPASDPPRDERPASSGLAAAPVSAGGSAPRPPVSAGDSAPRPPVSAGDSAPRPPVSAGGSAPQPLVTEPSAAAIAPADPVPSVAPAAPPSSASAKAKAHATPPAARPPAPPPRPKHEGVTDF